MARPGPNGPAPRTIRKPSSGWWSYVQIEADTMCWRGTDKLTGVVAVWTGDSLVVVVGAWS
jgi:hypothetical protein